MTAGTRPPDPESAAERRLDEHLELLRTSPPEPGRALARRTVRTARWQSAVRAPLRIAGLIAGALFDGVTKLPGSRNREVRR